MERFFFQEENRSHYIYPKEDLCLDFNRILELMVKKDYMKTFYFVFENSFLE
jgi:hypothetical protein